MKFHSTLQSHYSRRDRNGNCYWAFRYICHKTGKVVEGTITGGESNINAIRRYWNDSDKQGSGWDSGFLCQVIGHGIREFNSMTKGWAYAGCDPEELTRWIKQRLKGM